MPLVCRSISPHITLRRVESKTKLVADSLYLSDGIPYFRWNGEGARAIKNEIKAECAENKEEVKDPLCDQCLLPLDWVSGFGFGFGFGLVKR